MSETIFVVVQLIDGYAREDAQGASVVGVYTDNDKAALVASASGFGAKVFPVALDAAPKGILENAFELFPARAQKIFGEKP